MVSSNYASFLKRPFSYAVIVKAGANPATAISKYLIKESNTMARNTITRTMKTTHATVMVVDTETAEVSNLTFELPGTFKDDGATLKAIAKVADVPETTKIVAVVDCEVSEQLYAISEADFLKYAHPVVKPTPDTDNM